MSDSMDASSRNQAAGSTLGGYLRHIREGKRLKLKEIEEATGISNAYLSQLETGKIGKPSPHILHKLSSVYTVPYTVLMEKAGYITGDKDRNEDQSAIPGSRIPASALRDLSPEEEEAVLSYLAFLRYQRKSKG